MFPTHPCVTVGCDRCGQACWEHRDYPPHWPTETTALTELATYGWQVTGRRLVCAQCAATLACQTPGHQFTPWQPCLCDPRIPDHPIHPDGSCAMRYRFCGRYERVEAEHSTPDHAQEVLA